MNRSNMYLQGYLTNIVLNEKEVAKYIGYVTKFISKVRNNQNRTMYCFVVNM